MAVTNADLIFYAASNKPTDDIVAGGGAIDLKTKVLTTTLFDNKLAVVSSSASDIQMLTILGRGRNGLLATLDVYLNGTTQVNVLYHFDKILNLTLVSDAVGTITIKKLSTLATFTTIVAGSRGHTSLFLNSLAREGSEKIRYDKVFVKNTSADSLFLPIVSLVSDESSNLSFGVAATFDDSVAITNRLTAPAGITFYDAETIRTLATLTTTKAQGVWLKQTLEAKSLPEDSSFNLMLAGSAT